VLLIKKKRGMVRWVGLEFLAIEPKKKKFRVGAGGGKKGERGRRTGQQRNDSTPVGGRGDEKNSRKIGVPKGFRTPEMHPRRTPELGKEKKRELKGIASVPGKKTGRKTLKGRKSALLKGAMGGKKGERNSQRGNF